MDEEEGDTKKPAQSYIDRQEMFNYICSIILESQIAEEQEKLKMKTATGLDVVMEGEGISEAPETHSLSISQLNDSNKK